jgi:hypothetical protein
LTSQAALQRYKAAKASNNGQSSREQDISGEYSDDDDQLDLAVAEREEKLDASVTRAHNCLLTGQKLNTQIMLMLKGWKATMA